MVLGVAPEPQAEVLPCRYDTLNLVSYRLACTRLHRWVTGLQAMSVIPEIEIGASARRTAGFAPDVVVTVMDQLSYYKHAWLLARRLNVPLMTVTMDDPQAFQRAHPMLRPAYDRILRRIYADAALSLGVSPEMCSYIETQFGRESIPFLFGPPDGIIPRRADASGLLKRPPHLTLAYAGTMGLGYGDGIASILHTLRATGTRLAIYGRRTTDMPDDPLIEFRGFRPPETLWPEIQDTCDAVLLPYSNDAQFANIYRTHFPTKLSEYCWTGMPIVCSGPAYATGIRWANEHPSAAVAATSVRALTEALQALRDDPALRVGMASAAAAAAAAEFDPVAIRARFWSLLGRAAATGAKDRMGATA
jgi:glycosyltransferase involved in cell wall biosynthesis